MAVTYLTSLLAPCNLYILCPDTKNNTGCLFISVINQLDAQNFDLQ